MKKRLVEVELLEKGDKILLPSGKAIVIEDEKFLDPDDRFYGEVKVRWIDNAKGKKGKDTIHRVDCSLIERKKW